MLTFEKGGHVSNMQQSHLQRTLGFQLKESLVGPKWAASIKDLHRKIQHHWQICTALHCS